MSEAPNLSRESRFLRLGGMALMMGAMIAFTIFEDAVDPLQVLRNVQDPKFVPVALTCLAFANAFALGVILLLAGLRELSLIASAQARRGALARMGAANLMLLCFVFVALEDSGAFSEDFYTQWYIALVLVAFVVIARVSIMLFRSGWKYEARTAQEVVASDPRAPVLYLRSFGIDDQVMPKARGFWARLAASLNYVASVSPEQEMAFILERVGPVVAIGKPGERLPQLGAARLYVGDDEWRSVVGKLMKDAALVVIRAGETENLWWEVEETMRRCSRERVIIVALGAQEALAMFEKRFTDAFGAPNRRPTPSRSNVFTALLRFLVPYGVSMGNVIYFDRHGQPWTEPLRFQVTWSGAALAPVRPYHDALQAAFRNVFAQLGLRWSRKRSLAGAVLLALFGGIFGLHHFYVGQRRRGLWYLAFFWLLVPMVLGWIDAVRLALLNERQFQALANVGNDSATAT